MAEEKKDKNENSSDEGKDVKEEKKQEFIQIPKEEYEGLKTKVGELGTFIDESKEFIRGSAVVVTTLASDPELSKSFKEALKKQGVVSDGQESGEQQEQDQKKKDADANSDGKSKITDEKVKDLEASNRGQIIADFEKETGISNMKPEERKIARQKVEGFLNDFGWSVQTAPLVSLRKGLEKAWTDSRVDQLREEGKLEGFAQMRNNQNGIMGTISGGAPDTSSQEEGLTEGQKKWAGKLGVDADKAKKTYQERDKEQTRVPPIEQKK